LVWFRHSISHWYDSDILSVIGMIQTYHQLLVWFKHICLIHTNDWRYVWIIPMTDTMPESYQWLIVCLHHTNDWWYIWIIPMTDNMSDIISHWYDLGILSVNGMIKVYYQSLVWFRHNSHWYDSDIVSVIGMIIPMTDNMSESYQWLKIYLNHTNDW
jgi:hypothetical protein